ncbi:hypothetical protein A3A84_00390 [Candidatus Collierbacteria bacterium RIFCSPLOWO2_01_FULL_50_23]|uniref:Uncharacterized protein n=2 Tax=Candidatus Collieribacteriota TaxID=1752725 RepID=A0A1F5ES18_9BACT|nr:MAG: hypothetical protein A3D09_03495 [Candidatus Collierbacteria bacterium RIFCSPHIGHO2_02_FULL_49_10]OGD71411.1 MAG: hypothetical protein A2703_04060 [Candidatus Collierbacteria bacterium RIFCSPHIGHO2_01_FULL_50_25]OGD74089.1 MAG: hypothetical protein A3A84_00390 [Candidatus Collierbacteria bacterium RIFCSPLOWO2_01_FULL_50_23]
MDLEYRAETKIKHERIQPKIGEICRLSTAANIVNFFQGRVLFNPEQALEVIDRQRAIRGLPPFNSEKDSPLDEEIRSFIEQYAGGVGDLECEGRRFMNLSFWHDLVEAGFIIVPDHQMLYTDPKVLEKNDLFYLPADLVRRAVFEEEFSYQTFLDLYSFYFTYNGRIAEGHVDMVFDVINVNGLDSIVLANLGTRGNEYPVAVPWNLFRNYLAFEWTSPALTDLSQLPSEEQAYEIMEKGNLDVGEINIFYGSFDVYYPIAKRTELDDIRKRHQLI